MASRLQSQRVGTPSLEKGLAAVHRFHLLTFGDSIAFDLCAVDTAFDAQGRLKQEYSALRVSRSSRVQCAAPQTDARPFLGAHIVALSTKGDSLIIDAVFTRNIAVGWRERYAIISRAKSGVAHVMEFRITTVRVI